MAKVLRACPAVEERPPGHSPRNGEILVDTVKRDADLQAQAAAAAAAAGATPRAVALPSHRSRTRTTVRCQCDACCHPLQPLTATSLPGGIRQTVVMLQRPRNGRSWQKPTMTRRSR